MVNSFSLVGRFSKQYGILIDSSLLLIACPLLIHLIYKLLFDIFKTELGSFL